MHFRKLMTGMMAGAMLLTLAQCDKEESGDTLTYTFQFENGKEEWESFFSDYPEGEEELYELDFERTGLPAPLDHDTYSLKLSGKNHSDDLLSIIHRKFTGLKPNTKYKVTFDVDMASIAPTNSFGVGGSPDLAFGAGGIDEAPANTVDDQNHNRPNFESALQSGESNAVFKVLGRIGVKDNNTEWTMINRNNKKSAIILETNDAGELWLMLGTDSGFEATTTLYFKRITIRLTP